MYSVRPHLKTSTATDNATTVKASNGFIHAAWGFSINDAPCYVHIYDKSTAPVSTDTAILTIALPSNAVAASGAGSNLPGFGGMIECKYGISYRITKDFLSTGTTAVDASEVIFNMIWR